MIIACCFLILYLQKIIIKINCLSGNINKIDEIPLLFHLRLLRFLYTPTK